MTTDILNKCKETIEMFAAATMVEGKVIDASGKVLHSVDNSPCDNCVCRCIPSASCRSSHFFGAQQALLFGGAYVFFCPIGLVHFVSPIVIQNKMVCALLGGHFLMTEPDVFLIRNILKYVDDDKVIKDFVQNISVVEPSRVKALSDMLKVLSLQIGDGSEVIKKELDRFNLTEAKHHHAIHKAVNYIRENYMNKVTLEEVAAEVHFTTQYLSKIFKEETGSTFKQFVTETRTEMSKKLLIQGDLPMTEVAYLTGFSDQSHFSKSFKKVTGVSPRTYQLSHVVYEQ